jgi:predicted ATPase
MVAELLRFEGFEADLSAHRVRRAGREVHLQRIPFQLLCLLIDRRGQLVTREEIVERIWGKGVFIDSENAINTAVRKLRRALNDDAKVPRLIITVPSRGYRFDAALGTANEPLQVRRSQSSLVGRKREMTGLHAALAQAASGHGSLFLISGQAGIGKTRLARELGALAQAEGMEVLVGQCSEHDEAIPYLPFVEILESLVERASGKDHLRTLLGEEGPELARLLPKIKRLLPDLPPALDLPPQEARRHLFNCICDFIGRMSRDHATLLILEDLHWADDSSLWLLGHLARRLSGLQLMVVATYRDVELDISPGLARTLEEFLRGRLATGIKLAGLERNEIVQMLRSISGQEPPVAIVNKLYDETAGNPFFVEELFRHLEEEHRLYDADGVFRPELEIAEAEVPASVRLVVGRRLTRLGERAQKMLGTAATIGRVFKLELVEAASQENMNSILESVEEAEKAGLLLSRAESSITSLEFSHELARQAVLNGLSTARRLRLHLEVAEAIERRYSDILEDYLNELAHHYGQSLNPGKALPYLERAADRAEAAYAYKEAQGSYEQALALLSLLPQSAERDLQELELRQSIIRMLSLTTGKTSPESVDARERAVALAEKSGNLSQLLSLTFDRARAAHDAGDYESAATLADEVLEHALREGNPTNLGLAYALQVSERYVLGDLAGSEEYFARGLKFFEDTTIWSVPFTRVNALSVASYNAWMGGRADLARERIARMMAANQNNPAEVAFSAGAGAMCYIALRENEQAEVLAAQALELAEKHQMPHGAELARCWLGWARARLDHPREGVALIRQGIAGLAATGAHNSIFDIGLAESQALAGAIGDALQTVEQVLQRDRPIVINAIKSAAFRIRGELQMKQGRREAAEADFRTALTIAVNNHPKVTPIYQLKFPPLG